MIRMPILLALMLMGGRVAHMTPSSKTVTHSIVHYDIDIPAAFSITNVSPQMGDFELYEVVRGSKNGARLGLYFGNHPDFPKYRWSGTPHIESNDARTAKDFPYSTQSKRMEGLIAFNGLRYKDSAQSPYSFVHYFSDQVGETEARDFAEIVRSIRVARVHLK